MGMKKMGAGMKGHSSGHHHHSHTPIKSGAAGVRPMSAGFALNRSAADRQRQSHMNHINNSINNGGGGAGGGRAGGVVRLSPALTY